MATVKKLAPIVLIPFLVCLALGQDKIVSKVPNVPKIIRLWTGIGEATKVWNEEMAKVHGLIIRRFDRRVVDADPDASRRQQVAHLKVVREALLKDLNAVNELIDEDDY